MNDKKAVKVSQSIEPLAEAILKIAQENSRNITVSVCADGWIQIDFDNYRTVRTRDGKEFMTSDESGFPYREVERGA